jgi:hypothetical protein
LVRLRTVTEGLLCGLQQRVIGSEDRPALLDGGAVTGHGTGLLGEVWGQQQREAHTVLGLGDARILLGNAI